MSLFVWPVQVGGNKRMRKMFKKLGIEKESIAVKYNNPELERYREKCVCASFA